MNPNNYFLHPTCATQRQYEALKAFYIEGLSVEEVASKFGFTPSYFKKIRSNFKKKLKQGVNPFFPKMKTGPKGHFTKNIVLDKIVILRKQNYSILDKKAHDLGSELRAPYMTLSFMALLVIPELKLSDKGLFDGVKFSFTNLFSQ